jgi:hypothetical protein
MELETSDRRSRGVSVKVLSHLNMSLFYDPKSKKTQPWVFALMIIVPIVLFVLVLMMGGQMTGKKKIQTQSEEKDIFAK